MEKKEKMIKFKKEDLDQIILDNYRIKYIKSFIKKYISYVKKLKKQNKTTKKKFNKIQKIQKGGAAGQVPVVSTIFSHMPIIMSIK